MRLAIRKMTVGIVLAVAALAAAIPLNAASASTPTVGVGVQLLDTGPAGPPAYGTPDTYIGTVYWGHVPDPITAGTSRSYTVRFTNAGSGQEDVSVLAAAASMTNGSYLPTNDGVNDLSSWISVSDSLLSLAPGAHQDVTVTVTVPAGTSPGTRYAVVWGKATGTGGQVHMSAQAGVRAYVTS